MSFNMNVNVPGMSMGMNSPGMSVGMNTPGMSMGMNSPGMGMNAQYGQPGMQYQQQGQYYGGSEVVQTTTTVMEYGAPSMGWGAYATPRKVALRAVSGQYLVAEHSTLFSHHNDHGGKGHFHIKHLHSNVVEIVTHHGKYVGLNSMGQPYLSDWHHDTDTKFHMEWYGNRVAFKVHHGIYLSIEFNGMVVGVPGGAFNYGTHVFEELPVY